MANDVDLAKNIRLNHRGDGQFLKRSECVKI